MSKTTFLTDELLDHVYRNLAFTGPANVFASLFTAITTKETATGTEASYTGYARQSTAFGVPVVSVPAFGRQIANTALESFGQKTDVGSITAIAVGIHDAVSAGNAFFIMFNDGGDPQYFIVTAADLAGDTLQHGGHQFANDDQVRLEFAPGGGGLPTGLSEDTTYFVVSATADTIDLALTMGGASIDITAIGEALVWPLLPVTVNQNDTPEIAIGALVVQED